MLISLANQFHGGSLDPAVPRAFPVLLVLLALAGCGSDDPPPRDPAPVRLTIEAPPDTATVKEDTVELRGRVSPARATVEVAGEAAPVSNGAFSKTVKLDEGVNVIDVSATMPGRSAAFAALRVTYDPRVTVGRWTRSRSASSEGVSGPWRSIVASAAFIEGERSAPASCRSRRAMREMSSRRREARSGRGVVRIAN